MSPSSPARRSILVAVIVIGLIVAAALVGAWRLSLHHHGGATQSASQAVVKYTCPMHPSYISDRPGTCPICGMALVPLKVEPQQMPGMPMPEPKPGVDAKGSADAEPRVAVTIDAEKRQRIGVTTATAAMAPAVAVIRAAGTVAFDPDLAVAQREFLEARRVNDAELARASRERLTVMGMSSEQIDGLARRGKTDEGLVLPAKNAWVYATIFERELPLVHPGAQAAIELSDGTSAGTGTVRAIDSVLNPQTRSARARIEVENSAAKLRPNMFVTALLKNDLGEKLIVPASAVIASGTRKLVFVVQEGERFSPREVVTGPEVAGGVVIESGIVAGETVATSALFLIDSESKLRANAENVVEHHHGEGEPHD